MNMIGFRFDNPVNLVNPVYIPRSKISTNSFVSLFEDFVDETCEAETAFQ
jgi:hypothetical protein